MEWNVLLGSAEVSWGRVQAIRTATKETRKFLASSAEDSLKNARHGMTKSFLFFYALVQMPFK